MSRAFSRSHSATSTLVMLANDTVGQFEIPDFFDSTGGIFASVLPPERSTDRRLGVNACTPVTHQRALPRKNCDISVVAWESDRGE